MSRIKHELFMIAAQGRDLIVTVTCNHPLVKGSTESRFRKCTYEVAIPRETAQEMTVEQVFELAIQVFHSIKDDF